MLMTAERAAEINTGREWGTRQRKLKEVSEVNNHHSTLYNGILELERNCSQDPDKDEISQIIFIFIITGILGMYM